jgi:hypothetical protein
MTYGKLIHIYDKLIHIYGKLIHIYGKLIHIYGKLIHISRIWPLGIKILPRISVQRISMSVRRA